jgi:hypothetical protein
MNKLGQCCKRVKNKKKFRLRAERRARSVQGKYLMSCSIHDDQPQLITRTFAVVWRSET